MIPVRVKTEPSGMFLRDLPVEVMLLLLKNDDFSLSICHKLGASYSSFNNTFKKLREFECVEIYMPDKRKKMYKLTPYGIEIANALKKIKEVGTKVSLVE